MKPVAAEPPQATTTAAATAEPTVGLSVGDYNFVFPNEMIVEALGKISAGHMKQKGHPGHIASYDLSRIVAPNRVDDEPRKWSSICIRKFDDECILLADDVVSLPPEPSWLPAGALPLALSRAVRSVRFRDDKTDFLVKADVFENIPPETLSEMAKTGLRGWVRRFRTEPAHGRNP